ncbi:hypothetical protein EDD22DRAFT_852426 [Suillus occidentalis]|nr:hypothetical protein EDD22DRAFT_852426 [Suillus occidentalis]
MGSNLSPDSSDTTLALLTQLVQIGLGSSASIYPGPFHCQYKDPIDRLRKLASSGSGTTNRSDTAVARTKNEQSADKFSATLPLPLNRPRANNPPSPLCPMVGHCSSSVKRKQKTREPQQKIANTIDAPLGHATYVCLFFNSDGFADIVGVDNGEQPYVLFFCLSWFKKKKKKEVQQPPVYDDELEDDEEEEIVLDPVAVPLPWAHFTYFLSLRQWPLASWHSISAPQLSFTVALFRLIKLPSVHSVPVVHGDGTSARLYSSHSTPNVLVDIKEGNARHALRTSGCQLSSESCKVDGGYLSGVRQGAVRCAIVQDTIDADTTIIFPDSSSIPDVLRHIPYSKSLPPADTLLTPLQYMPFELEAFNIYGATRDCQESWSVERNQCRTFIHTVNPDWAERYTCYASPVLALRIYSSN